MIRSAPGTYALILRASVSCRLRIGRLGAMPVEPGFYVYVGSARRNLAARLARHRRARKTLRWHIDYLLALPQAVIRAVEIRPWRAGAECRWARQTRHEGGRVVIDGFGASDCRSRCGSHLLLVPAGPAD